MTGNHIIIAIIHVMKYHKRFEKPYIFLVTLSANSQGSLEIALPMVVRNSKSLYKCLHVFYCFLLFSIVFSSFQAVDVSINLGFPWVSKVSHLQVLQGHASSHSENKAAIP